MTRKFLPIILLACFTALPSPAAEFPREFTENFPAVSRVKDGPAQVALGLQDGVLAHTSLTVTKAEKGKIRSVKGYEFVVRTRDRDLTPFDFKIARLHRDGPGGADLCFRAVDLPLSISVHYRQEHGASFIRKWIEITPDPGAPIFVDAVVLLAFEPWVEPESFEGAGQPVYVGDTYWGVAYPSADNVVLDGKVYCSYLVGLTVDETGYRSRESVYGLGQPGRVRKAFFEYVDQIRARPATPFLLWNSWYDLRNFTEEEALESIKGLENHLVDPYGVTIHSLVLDDGWDDWSRAWRPHRKRFPNGFGPVSEAAKGLGGELGLWMSPVGGYAINHNRRMLGTLGQGYEKNLAGYCFAGENYQREFTKIMVEYSREFDVNYYKLDNLNTTCSSTSHGHRTGKYDKVGLTDAFIDTLETVRETKPQVMINFTVGSWLSPWWLMYSDAIWRGGMDWGAAGTGSRRQQSITYVDKILHKRLREERSQYPINSLMTHGILKGKYQDFGEQVVNLREFEDNCFMYFGRGVMMQELYLSPELLTPREWEVLARAIQFANDNAALLARSEMVMGDPVAGEVYGYFHELGAERMLVARNPRGVVQSLPVSAPHQYLGGEAAIATCQVVYPTTVAEVLSELAPFEVRIIKCGAGQ